MVEYVCKYRYQEGTGFPSKYGEVFQLEFDAANDNDATRQIMFLLRKQYTLAKTDPKITGINFLGLMKSVQIYKEAMNAALNLPNALERKIEYD